jgi:hypothetical protein
MAPADIEAAVAAQLAQRPAADVIELAADDEGRAAMLFLQMQTQWHFIPAPVVHGCGGIAIRSGLRYEALPVVAAACEVQLDGQVLADLREIEAEVMRVDAEQRR